ncbi:hypothetical protein SUGI_1142590 [Cryptomeria japonica]|nr:hypothetical protein SUGI_1142590 [Cryptomeria japonica]
MVAGSFSVEIDSSVEAKRLWNGMVKDGHNLIPKLAPQLFEGVTFVKGNGGVGTILNTDFSYVKERIDEIDEENLVYSFSQVEGGVVGTKLASVTYQVKFSPKADGGTLVIYICNYDSLPGVAHDEAKIEEIKEKSTELFKLIEAYLIANPTSYC